MPEEQKMLYNQTINQLKQASHDEDPLHQNIFENIRVAADMHYETIPPKKERIHIKGNMG